MALERSLRLALALLDPLLAGVARLREPLGEDGVGLADGAGIGTSPTGHLGLRLLHDSVKEIGGELTLSSDEAGGARLSARFPAALLID